MKNTLMFTIPLRIKMPFDSNFNGWRKKVENVYVLQIYV